jgi:integrase
MCAPDHRDGPAAPGSRNSGGFRGAEAGDERKTSADLDRRRRRPGRLEAGPFGADVASFRLHLAAENKAAGTIRIYTEAPLWFAAAYLLRETGKTGWGQVGTEDVQRWVTWLLGRYSAAYASNQFRALQQFFKWLAAEDEIPDPMAGLRPPHVPDKPVPVFADGDLRRLERACAGRSFQQRRAPLSSPCSRRPGYGCQRWPASGMTRTTRGAATSTCGSGRSPSTARAAERARSRSATMRRAAWTGTCAPVPGTPRHTGRSCGWGINNRGPMTASGIYQVIARRGEQCGVEVFPHRFRHHFSHTWLDRGGAEGDLMELNGWTSPQMLRRYGASARGARARRGYDRIMDNTPS